MAQHHISLPAQTYRKLLQIAKRRNLDVTSLIETYIASDNDVAQASNWSELDPAVSREKTAFLRLHPQLIERFLNEYVAVFNGELVDHDQDLGSLANRVDANYPDNFVWISKVEIQALPPLRMRSPRLVNP